jgi:hypothetical protein
MTRAVTIILAVMFLLAPAFAHDHGYEDAALLALKNGDNVNCCDGSDALSVLDPDWEIAGDCYRVRQSPRHQWINLRCPNDIVKEKNTFGVAKVWPTVDGSGTWTTVRCFLPGSGI